MVSFVLDGSVEAKRLLAWDVGGRVRGCNRRRCDLDFGAVLEIRDIYFVAAVRADGVGGDGRG